MKKNFISFLDASKQSIGASLYEAIRAGYVLCEAERQHKPNWVFILYEVHADVNMSNAVSGHMSTAALDNASCIKGDRYDPIIFSEIFSIVDDTFKKYPKLGVFSPNYSNTLHFRNNPSDRLSDADLRDTTAENESLPFTVTNVSSHLIASSTTNRTSRLNKVQTDFLYKMYYRFKNNTPETIANKYSSICDGFVFDRGDTKNSLIRHLHIVKGYVVPETMLQNPPAPAHAPAPAPAPEPIPASIPTPKTRVVTNADKQKNIVDTAGHELLSQPADDIQLVNGKTVMAIIMQDGKYNMVGYDGNMLLDCWMDKISGFCTDREGDFAIVTKNGVRKPVDFLTGEQSDTNEQYTEPTTNKHNDAYDDAYAHDGYIGDNPNSRRFSGLNDDDDYHWGAKPILPEEYWLGITEPFGTL